MGTKKVPAATSPRTLSVDIGGSGIKLVTLDEHSHPTAEFRRTVTPHPATPAAVLTAIVELAKLETAFDRIACGFPGVVKKGIVYAAPNLDPSWKGFNLAEALTAQFGKPTRVANDAAVQGYGAVEGKGQELMITLGTGLGSSLFQKGKLVASLEMAHHPFRKGKTYEQFLGNKAFEKGGKKRWNKLLLEAINNWFELFHFDYLYIGGGNAKKVTAKLPENAKITANVNGIYGGLRLWEDDY